MPTAARLEQLIESDPTILGEPLLMSGRQVITSYGKIIDLLAVDAEAPLPTQASRLPDQPRMGRRSGGRSVDAISLTANR
jgi:hypothetical protein